MKGRRKKIPRARPSHLNVGVPPGTLAAPPGANPTLLRMFAFDGEQMDESEVENLESLRGLLDEERIGWLEVTGFQDTERIRAVAEFFDLHPLAMEDALNGQSPSTVDDYGEVTFLVTRWCEIEEARVQSRQLSLFLGPGWVVSVSDGSAPFLEAIRQRVRSRRTRIRSRGADYLAYAIVDAVVDSYFPVLEAHAEQLDRIEEEVMGDPHPSIVQSLYVTRRNLLTLRRVATPLREAVGAFERLDYPGLQDETRIYLRDCYDHTSRTVDLVAGYRDWASSLMEVYLSKISFRTSEITKVLTIIATIFIPLTFLAGLYGMNFNTQKSPLNMPELNWFWGYPFALSLMGLLAATMSYYFWRRGWIGSRR